ncbi:hypothetical protein [Shewanella sp. Isolate7]|uniref:hypothetical protein n=1 Tax=Shewanella sp. Isolate7 TaxID=2908528 RepID=UPI001EFE5025|nr:hypothetical protein [Shewanella sp. Isolate7]MCG9722905.1 hypothetical protein [Shewanella sp. Isolate7]
MKQQVKGIFYFIIITFPQFGVTEEVKIFDFGRYVGHLYSDGSGSVAKRFDPKVTESCKSFSCRYDRENADVNSVFKNSWSFHIKNDEMTDKQVITVSRKAYKISKDFGEMKLNSNIYLWLNISDKDEEILCISGHNYPKKKGMIRVDNNDLIETNVNGCLPLNESLDSQMRSGNKITIRGYHWPYDGAETFDIDLGGYTKTMTFLRGQRLD